MKIHKLSSQKRKLEEFKFLSTLKDFNWDVREGDYQSISDLTANEDFYRKIKRKKMYLIVIFCAVTAFLTYLILLLTSTV